MRETDSQGEGGAVRGDPGSGLQARDTCDQNSTTRMAAYLRVSTTEQTNGVSLDAQRSRAEAYCTAHGYELVDVVVDGGSSAATVSKRPKLVELLERLDAGEADGLLVLRLDRLSRSTRDVLDLVERASKGGWSLHSISESLDTSSPAGRLVVTILGAINQMERETIGLRTREALAERRRQGLRVSGRPPWGYRFDRGRLVEVPEEGAVLAKLVALRSSGKGAKLIARGMNEGGVNLRTGKPWTYGTVAAILRRLERKAS